MLCSWLLCSSWLCGWLCSLHKADSLTKVMRACWSPQLHFQTSHPNSFVPRFFFPLSPLVSLAISNPTCYRDCCTEIVIQGKNTRLCATPIHPKLYFLTSTVLSVMQMQSWNYQLSCISWMAGIMVSKGASTFQLGSRHVCVVLWVFQIFNKSNFGMLYLIICYIKHIKSILKLPKPKFHFKKVKSLIIILNKICPIRISIWY